MTMTVQPIITLRAMEPEDLDFLYGIENDQEVWNVGATNVPYSRYTLYDYIANSKNDIYTDRQVRLIIENSGKTVVGTVDITNFDPRHMRAEVGIVIQKSQRRQGYALSALLKTVELAFRSLNLHQLYAVIPEDNEASVALFEKCGFTRNAELKDWLISGDRYQKAYLFQLFCKKPLENFGG